MFTGIVQGKAQVKLVEDMPQLKTLQVEFPAGSLDGLAIGASVAIQGVCLTVTGIKGATASFDVMGETLSKTTVSDWKQGSWVNFERSAKVADEVGGHQLSGHVDGLAKVLSIERPENNVIVSCQAPEHLRKFIFQKGFIALNGVSLTLNDVDSTKGTFDIWLIPETLRVTTFGTLSVGETINIEIDRTTQAIVETVERFLQQSQSENLKKTN